MPPRKPTSIDSVPFKVLNTAVQEQSAVPSYGSNNSLLCNTPPGSDSNLELTNKETTLSSAIVHTLQIWLRDWEFQRKLECDFSDFLSAQFAPCPRGPASRWRIVNHVWLAISNDLEVSRQFHEFQDFAQFRQPFLSSLVWVFVTVALRRKKTGNVCKQNFKRVSSAIPHVPLWWWLGSIAPKLVEICHTHCTFLQLMTLWITLLQRYANRN